MKRKREKALESESHKSRVQGDGHSDVADPCVRHGPPGEESVDLPAVRDELGGSEDDHEGDHEEGPEDGEFEVFPDEGEFGEDVAETLVEQISTCKEERAEKSERLTASLFVEPHVMLYPNM